MESNGKDEIDHSSIAFRLLVFLLVILLEERLRRFRQSYGSVATAVGLDVEDKIKVVATIGSAFKAALTTMTLREKERLRESEKRAKS